MKNHSDELIFHSQGLRRSAANLEIASENSPSRNSPRVSSRKALRHGEKSYARRQGSCRGRFWRGFSFSPPRMGKFLDFGGRFWRKFSLLPPRMGDFLDFGGRFRRGIFVVAPTDGKILRFRGAACSGTCFSLPHENVKASSSWGGFFRHFLRPPHGS